MTQRRANRRAETSTVAAITPTVSLLGPLPGYASFGSIPGIQAGDTFTYVITSQSGQWESGLGSWIGPNSFLRSGKPYDGSNGTNPTNFAPGTKTVFLDISASELPFRWLDANTTLVDGNQYGGIDSVHNPAGNYRYTDNSGALYFVEVDVSQTTYFPVVSQCWKTAQSPFSMYRVSPSVTPLVGAEFPTINGTTFEGGVGIANGWVLTTNDGADYSISTEQVVNLGYDMLFTFAADPVLPEQYGNTFITVGSFESSNGLVTGLKISKGTTGFDIYDSANTLLGNLASIAGVGFVVNFGTTHLSVSVFGTAFSTRVPLPSGVPYSYVLCQVNTSTTPYSARLGSVQGTVFTDVGTNATPTLAGIVRPDNQTISVNSGVISKITSWAELKDMWSATPVPLITDRTATNGTNLGNVLRYTRPNQTYYRFLPFPYVATKDAFYTTYVSATKTVSGLIVARG